jgi:hypothetical protein
MPSRCCNYASFQVGPASMMPKSQVQIKFLKADKESTSEQFNNINDVFPPIAHRRPSSPMDIPASPNIFTFDAALRYQANGTQYITASCGNDRMQLDNWWTLPDLQASLKRHRQLIRQCPPWHAAIAPSSLPITRGGCGGRH